MEIQTATPPPTKKMRSSQAPSGQQAEKTGSISPPPTTDAPDLKSAEAGGDGSRRQEPLLQAGGAGGGGEAEAGGVDHTNALPGAILQDIISLLPTKDAGRAATVASRWHELWCSAPLNLDFLELPEGPDALVDAVSGILAAHLGPGRCFRIDTRLLHSRPQTLDAWLQSRALDGLHELDFSDHRVYRPVSTPRPPLPASVFRFAPSLRVATLSHCSIPDALAQGLHFPKMQKLGLERVSISNGSLQRLIAGCPVLESLLLSLSSCCVRVRSASLRNIGVGTPLSYDNSSPGPAIVEVIIEEAPSLKKLLFLEEHLGFRVTIVEGAAPKLETLGCMYDTDSLSRFVFGSTVIQTGLNVVGSRRTVMHSIKVLAVSLFRLSLDKVIDFMMCLPCLEKLYIESCRCLGNNLWRRKHRNLIGSSNIRLKTIVFLNYRGIKAQQNFATFFILNAKRLETMRFEGRSCYMENKDFIAQQHESLQVEKRASTGAKFYFVTDRCGHHLTHVKYVHDLSITDPFECTC